MYDYCPVIWDVVVVKRPLWMILWYKLSKWGRKTHSGWVLVATAGLAGNQMDKVTIFHFRFSTWNGKLDNEGGWIGDIENATAVTQSFISKTFIHLLTVGSLRSFFLFNLIELHHKALRHTQWDKSNTIGALKQGERVNVKIDPMNIFLQPDGIYAHPLSIFN